MNMWLLLDLLHVDSSLKPGTLTVQIQGLPIRTLPAYHRIAFQETGSLGALAIPYAILQATSGTSTSFLAETAAHAMRKCEVQPFRCGAVKILSSSSDFS